MASAPLFRCFRHHVYKVVHSPVVQHTLSHAMLHGMRRRSGEEAIKILCFLDFNSGNYFFFLRFFLLIPFALQLHSTVVFLRIVFIFHFVISSVYLGIGLHAERVDRVKRSTKFAHTHSLAGCVRCFCQRVGMHGQPIAKLTVRQALCNCCKRHIVRTRNRTRTCSAQRNLYSPRSW